MLKPIDLLFSLALVFLALPLRGAEPVKVRVRAVTASHGIVVAGHPEAAAAGLATLKAGGNAIDAAVTTSLALGAAEPYASGLGGKLLLLYYEAASGHVFVVDGLDMAGDIDPDDYRARAESGRSGGPRAVCVPGLPAGLGLAHQKWGRRAWAADVAPAIQLAREGAVVLPKIREHFAAEESRLRHGDTELRRLYLPAGELPVAGARLKNEDLARTMETIAREGAGAFYRGEIAERIVAAVQAAGGGVTAEAMQRYAARRVEPIGVEFRGYSLRSAPPPAAGAAMYLAAMKVFEPDRFAGAPLRRADNLDRLGRVWRWLAHHIPADFGDLPESRGKFDHLVSAESLRRIRLEASTGPLARAGGGGMEESRGSSTTHFIVVDVQRNVVCATQSLGVHFGSGLVAPGTGVLLNNSMANFDYQRRRGGNAPAAYKRPATTMSPTIVLRAGQPVLALGLPGALRIPTTMLQVSLDYLALGRRFSESLADTRVHFAGTDAPLDRAILEVESTFPADAQQLMTGFGWNVEVSEPAGTGQRFGGVNAVVLSAGGKLEGYADPRRANAAAGY